jgi:hypothetical protein
MRSRSWPELFVHQETVLYGKYYCRLQGKRLESVTRNGDYVTKDFAFTMEGYYFFFAGGGGYRGTSRGHQEVLQNALSKLSNKQNVHGY